MSAFVNPADTLPIGARTLPGRYYTSPEIFAIELERIFYNGWTAVGRESQLHHRGDYLVVEIGDESVIVVRDRDGVVRAFFNSCRHRGARLCEQSSGHGSAFRCPYHGWTYSLRGDLLAAPLMHELPDFCGADFSLRPVAVGSWEGFLFLNLSPAPVPFDAVFGEHDQRFARWHLPRVETARRIKYDVRANWKIVVENFSECYHCPLIHPEFASKVPYRSGRNDLTEGPFLGGYMELNPGVGSLTRSGGRCGPVLGDVGGDDLGRVYFYAIFPNLTLGLHPDYVMTFTLWPLACDRTTVVVEWLFDRDAHRRGECAPDDAMQFWDNANREDWVACESLQKGLRSRAYRPSPYSTAEALLVAFNREVLKAVDGHHAVERRRNA